MQTGYWRASANTTAIIRCPDASLGNSACQGGTGAPCKPALTGAYCRVCVDEWAYYDESDANCKSCALLPPETILLIGLALLLALSLIAQCLLIVRARKIEQARRDALAFAANASPAQARGAAHAARRTLALQQLRERESDRERVTHLQTQRSRISRFSLDLNTFHGSDEPRDSAVDFADKPSRRQRVSMFHEEAASSSQREGAGAAANSTRALRRLQSLVTRAGVSCKLRLLISFLQVGRSPLDVTYRYSW